VALVGLDLMDTQERAKRKEESADTFFGYFTDNFTAGEWKLIRSAGPVDTAMYTQVCVYKQHCVHAGAVVAQ
jgi:hypothetical protein